MKLLPIILFSVGVFQLSMAATTRRVKRDDNLVNGIKEIIYLYKKAVPIIDIVMSECLAKIPNTPAYNKYRDDVQEYLKAMEEHKNIKGACVDKTFAIVTKYDELIESYEAEDAPAEAKYVAELLEGDKRIKALEKEAEEWSEQYNIENLEESIDSLGFRDAVALIPLVTEIC